MIPTVLAALALAAGPVRDYRATPALATEGPAGSAAVVLRTFTRGGERLRLIVDPETLATRVVPAAGLPVKRRPWRAVREAVAGTAYGRALKDAEANEKPLQGAGLGHLRPGRPGIDLTVDLCPSAHPLDRALFTALTDALGREARPLPVAIALTGAWMREHAADLEWLASLEREGTLAVTWVNHSNHHRASPEAPLEENFLLQPGTDVRAEVLDTEKAMLEAGLLPSVFFRFPGLVSRPDVFGTVVGLGLVPLGSDAWLAKSRKPPAEGSIVLVHANGNEPVGVRRFLELLRTERENIRSGGWQLLDLRQSVVDTEAGRPPRP
ncbi:MAG TPA: polysaccharide deacetylase [Vicinamibacteria bacterium]|nr:polysaccharide deacetylase [Vicinamibacteria bacterium]